MKTSFLPFSIRPHQGLLLALVTGAQALAACSSTTPPVDGDRSLGQSDFVSAPPYGQTPGGGEGTSSTGATGTGGSTDTGGLPPRGGDSSAGTQRKVEETDLYRVEGDRLYYLNGYRGLMIFDVADVDHPRLIGRSPIFGHPVEMIVRDGVATVVVADWYGKMDDGNPFHGSIVRGIDARDPAAIRVLGEAKLGGWVRDTRVVGDVLYAVSEEYDWHYGWYLEGGGGATGTATGPKVVVSSVSFANGEIRPAGRFETPGWGGVFNVTSRAIMFAHDVAREPGTSPNATPPQMALEYIDISDPGGAIVPRGSVALTGRLAIYGTDNGRWNLDFADGTFAHVVGCAGEYCGAGQGGYVVATADFTNPDAPSLASRFLVDAPSWSVAARFDGTRMYLAPGDAYWSNSNQTTPIRLYDLSDPRAPKFTGQTQITGSVWNFTPAGDRLFVLGSDAYDPRTGAYGNKISVRYLDVSDATKPTLLGGAEFGEGWAWTPAAGTFKAFTKNDAEQLVVLPFSGYSNAYGAYKNGLQLIEFTRDSLSLSGTAQTKGWVERGIFVKGRLVSLSDMALSVVDYSTRATPSVVAQLTLARNVVDAKPHGDTIAQLSSDWWYQNDQEHSELRVLPTAQADENVSGVAIAEIPINGVDARVFHDRSFSYVVSRVRHEAPCPPNGGATTTGTGGPDSPGQSRCYSWGQEVQVVEHAGGETKLRGKVALPDFGTYWYGGWGFHGCYMGDWYYGDEVVQVGGDVLAFRRWMPQYWPDGTYSAAHSSLWVVDLADPDAPKIASTTITNDRDGWWGNMRAVGNTLYTTHYEWYQRPLLSGDTYRVRYYLDRIDLADRAHPVVGAKINVPGILVGGSETDPSLIYTMDYRGDGPKGVNELDVLRISGDRAYLESTTRMPGYVGATFVRGNKAYMSAVRYLDQDFSRSEVQLYQADLTNPRDVKLTSSNAEKGWGWLLGVEGDRAIVTSGWGSDGIDIYRLSEGAPKFDQFVRTLGWWPSSLARQDNQLFLASGHWGVQTVDLR